MTPGYIMTIVLRRAGIHNPSTEQKTSARDYLNLMKTELEGLTVWRFLYKVGTITTEDGTRAYSLGSDVLEPIGRFFDVTNDRMIDTIHPHTMDEEDPDQDYEAEQKQVALTGINATTGYWSVDLYPTPDTTGESVKYRYYASHPDLVEGDDDTDLAPKYPRYIQAPLLWGTAGMYKGEKENDSESFEWQRYGSALESAIRINRRVSTSDPIQLPAGGETDNEFIIHGAVQVD